jgi:hypothetical protein
MGKAVLERLINLDWVAGNRLSAESSASALPITNGRRLSRF